MKNRWKKAPGLEVPGASLPLMGGGACHQRGECGNSSCLPFPPQLSGWKQRSVVRAQNPNVRRKGSSLPTWLLRAVSRLLRPHMLAACRGMRSGCWVARTVLRAAVDRKLTTMDCPGLLLEIARVQYAPKLQKSYIRQILPAWLLSRSGD